MPKGPRGKERPSSGDGCAVKVAKIANKEMEDDRYVASGRRKSSRKGAQARANRLSTVERKEISQRAAKTRWSKGKEGPMSEKDRLLGTLFNSPGKEHINIKFFRGHNLEVSEEDVCKAANKALFEIENGLTDASEDFEDDVKHDIEIKELVGAH